MAEVEVPPYFLCPISLQIMRDPVTLSTGITYDRESIERWIFSEKHDVCPVTKQPLCPVDLELTPNHTLRRLTQSWCAANASSGIERFPTPRQPVNRAQVVRLLEEAKLPHSQISTFRKLKSIVAESDRNKRCVEAAGAVDFLVSVIMNATNYLIREQQEGGGGEELWERLEPSTRACDEALLILHSLQISEQSRATVIQKNAGFIDTLAAIMSRSNYRSRAHAVQILKSLLSVMTPTQKINTSKQLIEEVVDVVEDRVSYPAVKAALQILAMICTSDRRNKVTAVEAGAVPAMIELLLDETEKRVCEMALMALDQLCGCAEGRAALADHAAGMAVVSKKILRVSEVASEMAVRVLHSLAKYSATKAVADEMLQVGVVSKMFLVLSQVSCGLKTKEKAREIVKLHARVWRESPCLGHFKHYYSSS
ncbi:E3 ubiquitin-protein ligase PUB22-like [Ananas comosus]|uniref:U-box domain-containing protein n=1 Tax=Ananas comosus TaxID=4615 RepID=A0A6P5GPU1_ANACO|nr:E3 ubiquitin-protein ligase PUB22-like [Ananas comosus]